jgi:hypothetical protein
MEPSSSKSLPPTATKKKINPLIIALVAAVILCCFCVGAIGILLAFGKPVLDSLGLLNAHLAAAVI